MRWLVSVPEVEQNKHVVRVSNIRITYIKEPLNTENFLDQLKGWGRKVVR